MFQVIQSFVAKLQFFLEILWDVITSQEYLTKLDIWEFYQPLVDIVHYVISPNDRSFTITSNGKHWVYESSTKMAVIEQEALEQAFHQIKSLTEMIKIEIAILMVGLVFFLVLVQNNKRKA